jgi:hypothetical protein
VKQDNELLEAVRSGSVCVENDLGLEYTPEQAPLLPQPGDAPSYPPSPEKLEVAQFQGMGTMSRTWQSTPCVPLAGSLCTFAVQGDELVITKEYAGEYPIAAAIFLLHSGYSLCFAAYSIWDVKLLCEKDDEYCDIRNWFVPPVFWDNVLYGAFLGMFGLLFALLTCMARCTPRTL